ncbi:penicillin-binding protein 1B [Gallaecimonas sp. GXIMD4217]|uniref:penicillin-binding protein 1B n=1 Tax=Gallaecimonas sp. GXIMD4217 TaxID=3131927 RepID=UPI00311AF0AC
MTSKQRKSRSKAAPRKAKKGKAQPKRRWWPLLAKLSLVMVAVLSLYAIYLDGVVRDRFEGQTWQLPAQIYGRPLSLYAGAPLSRDQLVDELKLLKYRKVRNPDQPGEFSASSAKVEIYRRPFAFPEGREGARRILVEFAGDRVEEVYDQKSGRPVAIERIEPVLVELLSQSGEEERIFVPLKDMPELLPKTLILVEDRKFYQHHGVSPLAIARALLANIRAGRSVQGGSTLTQQLAKNFFLTRERSLSRKINEALMALIIDLRYDKERILEAYLNEIFLGQAKAQAVHGVGLASRFYFGRPVSELAPEQMALLVGIIKGPSYYDPRRHPERARERRDLILRLMLEHDLLGRKAYERAARAPLGVTKERRLTATTVPAYMQKVRRELNGHLAGYVGDAQGVRVFTGLEPLAQQALEKAVALSFGRDFKGKELETAVVVTDKRSGLVKAMAGGKDVDFAGFNRALDAHRPIGSLAKPVVYMTALADPGRYNLASVLLDQPIALQSTDGDTWAPKNYDKQYRGQVALVDALVDSLNVPTVNLGMQLGVDTVLDSFRLLGVNADLPPYPSLFLGAASLSPLDVAQLYQGLASGGLRKEVAAVSAVTTGDGELLYQLDGSARAATTEEAAYLTNYAMTEVVRRGTAKSLGQRFPNLVLAGKTGTTDDYRDSWYAGFDARDLVVIWLGKDDNSPAGLTGATGSLRLYRRYLDYRQPISLRLRPPQAIVDARFAADGSYNGACRKGGRLLPADSSGLDQDGCDKVKGFLEKVFGW